MKNTLFIAATFTLFLFASCNNAPMTSSTAGKTDSTATTMESKAERNRKTIMQSMEGINAHDVNKVLKDAAPDFTEYGDGSMPPVKGDSAKQMLAMYLNAFPDMKADNSIYLADDHNAVIVSDWTMTFKNDMMGMKATGKTAKMKDVDIFTFDDNGKITSHRNIYPMGPMMMQLGVDMSKMENAGGKKK